MIVSDLLTLSMQAHKASYAARHFKTGDWRPLLIEARNKRLEAVADDPQRTDPSWAAEEAREYPGFHDAMVAFYTQQLG